MLKFFVCVALVFILLLGFPGTIKAEDLPIGADTIGAERHESPFRVRHNIDLFSENSQRLERGMLRHMQMEREALESGLFDVPRESKMVDFDGRVKDVTDNYALFAEPVAFNRILRAEPEARGVPTWLVVFIFVFCAASGFVLAHLVAQKRGQRKSVY